MKVELLAARIRFIPWLQIPAAAALLRVMKQKQQFCSETWTGRVRRLLADTDNYFLSLWPL